MGLKTTNYEVKGLGITLPKAYAIVKNLKIRNNHCEAEFAVQLTRTATQTSQPFETVKIYFELDRNESPFITAYKKAKGQYETLEFNEETHKHEKVTVNQPFYGWEDDIV